MSKIEALKTSITVTLNEIAQSHYYFATKQGLDLRDNTYRECMETIDRIERNLLAAKSKNKRRKPSTTS